MCIKKHSIKHFQMIVTNEYIELNYPGKGLIQIPVKLYGGLVGGGGTLFASYVIEDKRFHPILDSLGADKLGNIYWLSQDKYEYHYFRFRTIPDEGIDKNRVWNISPKSFVEKNNDSRIWLDMNGCCFQGNIEELVGNERKFVIEPDFPDGSRGIFKVLVDGTIPAYLFRWFFDSGNGLIDNPYENLSRGLCILDGDKDNLEYAMDCYKNNVVIF